MFQPSDSDLTLGRRYALCIGIGAYTNLINRDLRYAVADATTVAERLADPQRGNFAVTILTEPPQTTKAALEEAVEQLLNAPDRQTEDLVLLYFSCHGDVERIENMFCLLPSDTTVQATGAFEQTTLIGVSDLARWFSQAKTHNIVLLLDVCHSGGAGIALQHFNPHLETGPNYFILGAARQGQISDQSSRLKHGVFTYCLLRAFEQPPTKDGWLTISQIQNYISEEITWFAKDRPIQIQISSMSVNPSFPLLRNPGYPELCPLPPFWNVPFQRNIFFTEQDGLLSQLASMLQHEQKMALTQPSAISGLGGIGKTQVALEYAYRHRQDYHAVLWGRADTRESLISTFVTIASLLDLPQKDEQDQMVIVEAVKKWLMDRSRWLFILDNADELALVKEFLPPAFRGHLLLTTRTQVMGGLARKLEINVMRPEIGALLLLRRAGRLDPEDPLEKVPSVEILEAKELTQELGGLPLALDQAGAYIEETQCGLAEYQQRYRRQQARLLARRGGVVPEHPEPVATTWSLSFEKVEQADPTAAELLRFCAFLAPDAIPEELLVQAMIDSQAFPSAEQEQKRGEGSSSSTVENEKSSRSTHQAEQLWEIDEAVTVLRVYSLIQRNSQEGTLGVHRLVQAVMRASMTKGEQQRWMERTVRVVAKVLPAISFATWQRCEQYVPHAQECVRLAAARSSAEGARVVHWMGAYLLERQRTVEAGWYVQQALLLREQHLGKEHLETAVSLDRLARWWELQGKYAEAEPLYQRALSIRRQQLGLEHPDTATSLSNLAELYRAQGRYREAEPLYQLALAIYEQQLGATHSNTAIGINNLAVLYAAQGRYREAEPLYQLALAIYEQLGATHPDMASSLNNLANLYKSQGKYGEAEPLLKRALAVREQELGATHPDTASSLNDLAELYREQGKYSDAEPLYHRSLTILEQELGASHPSTATSLSNLASLYYSQGRYREAEPLLKRALAIHEQELGATHLVTATILDNLAELYRAQGEYEQAEPLSQRALSIHEQQLGPEHPDTATNLNNLASIYYSQGRYREAEPLLKRALQTYERTLGLEHPATQNIRQGYIAVLLLQAMGHDVKARKLEEGS